MSTSNIVIDHFNIDSDAIKVVRRLARYGHEAYLVGGCVRDLLLGHTPKDFDVATSATPLEIKKLFRNSRVIGRRFRLVHIFFGPKIIETATFRQNPRPESEDTDEPPESPESPETPAEPEDPKALLIRRDNVFGTAQDDALRRDFTCNGLFYDPVKRQVIDFVDGLADLERRSIRTIGDPDIRFQEDPVRIIRAIKFAARLGLSIETETYRALRDHRDKINLCAQARVLEEIYRLLREGAASHSMPLLEETGVLDALLPDLRPVIDDAQGRELLYSRLSAVDTLATEGVVSNPVLLAALYFGTTLPADWLFGDRADTLSELNAALDNMLSRWAPSRRDRDSTRQILLAQRRLRPQQKGRRNRTRRPMALVTQPYFSEALTLYRLFCYTGEADPSTIETWEGLFSKVTPPSADSRAPSRHRGRRDRGRRRPRSRHASLPRGE